MQIFLFGKLRLTLKSGKLLLFVQPGHQLHNCVQGVTAPLLYF